MKPIIFSSQSIQAILGGYKTQTRRVVHKDIVNGFDVERDGKSVIAYVEQATGDSYKPERAARYQKGDILWVRETWMPCADIESWLTGTDIYVYKADCTDAELREAKQHGLGWSSSIHMPRAAARLFLRVTDVRVERLQAISDEDAKAEGANFKDGRNAGFEEKAKRLVIDRYRDTWNALNAKRGSPWEANPWVWVYTFERIEKPEQEVSP